jgi:cyclic pyranopterin phosphate synthase
MAKSRGIIKLRSETIKRIIRGDIEKGDPILTAKIAGILAAKKTSSMIPLCHPLELTDIKLEIRIINKSNIEVVATVKTKARTGVEMEALMATSTALLTIWDMIKKYEKDSKGQYPNTAIQDIRIMQKTKGDK